MTSILVTGPIGSGKSTVLALLAELGWKTLAADEIVTKVQAPGGSAYKSLIDTFPDQLSTDATGDLVIDKSKLRDLVFSDPDAKACLLYTSPSPRDRTRSRMPSSA